MFEKESPFPVANSNGRIECKDVLGGMAVAVAFA